MRIATFRWVPAAVLAGVICMAPFASAQKPGRADVALEAAAKKEMVDGDLKGAIEQYQKVIAEFSSTDRASAAKALVRMGLCYEKLGSAEARRAYERAVRDFPDQEETVAAARARLVALNTARSGPTYRQVYAGPKVGTEGTISPDGRYLSYVDWETGDLALHDFATGADRRLTDQGTWAQSVRPMPDPLIEPHEFADESTISRDGKQVAYSWFNGTDRYELRVASLRATGLVQPRRVFDSEDVHWIGPYDWSPDGKWIAVFLQRKDWTNHVGLVSAETGSLRVLRPADGNGKAFFSPDGKYLGFDDRVPGRPPRDRDVSIVTVDGGGEVKAVVNPSQDVMMGWSPDGKLLLFASDRTGSMALWGVPVGAGKTQGTPVLLRPEIAPTSLGLTAAGALYVRATVSDRDIHVASLDFNTGKVLSPPARPIQTFMGSNSQPDWSPDGKYLAYASVHSAVGGDKVLSIRSVESGETRDLHPSLAGFNWPRWAPDGRSFVSQGTDSQGRQGIYRIDAQTGEVTPIAYSTPGSPFRVPQWSPDGRRIFYASGSAIFERELASGDVRQLIQRKGLISTTASVSPDGRYIAVRAQLERPFYAVLLIPAAGGEPRELLRTDETQALGNPLLTGDAVVGSILAWAPGGRGVIVQKIVGTGQRRELWLIPVEGGEPRKLDLAIDQDAHPMRVHPDGRQVAYVVGTTRVEVLVLENFLPAGKAAGK